MLRCERISDERAASLLVPSVTTSTTSADSNHPGRHRFAAAPPSKADLVNTIELITHRRMIHLDPFFSNPADVPRMSREYAGKRYPVYGNSTKWLQPFEHVVTVGPPMTRGKRLGVSGVRRWEWGRAPLSKSDAVRWIETQSRPSRKREERGASASQPCGRIVE